MTTAIKNLRKASRARVTNLLTSWSDSASVEALGMVDCRFEINKVNSIHNELNTLNDKLLAIETDFDTEEKAKTEYKKIDDYRDKICKILSILQTKMSALTKSEATSAASASATTAFELQRPAPLLKGPLFDFPKFKGEKLENFARFIAEFEIVAKKFNPSEESSVHFLLLKKALAGSALNLVDSLCLGDQTYILAKQLLEKRFADVREEKANVISGLMDLHFDFKDDPDTYYSNYRKLLEKGNMINLTVNDFYQFYFWNNSNKSFRTIMTQVTGQSLPNFQEQLDSYFDCVRRYKNNQEQYNTRKLVTNKPASSGTNGEKQKTPYTTKAATYASAVPHRGKPNPAKPKAEPSKKFVPKPCALCNNTEHRESQCPKYLSTASKRTRLLALGRCVKCFGLHSGENCTLSTKFICKHCGKSGHFPTLCEEQKPQQSKFSNVREDVTSCAANDTGPHTTERSASLKGAVARREGRDSILPTFTCRSSGVTLRGMKDSGSQSSFITQDMLDRINHKVTIPDYSLTLEGINSEKTYATKEVEIELEFGNLKHFVKALVLPSLSTDTQVKGLGELVGGLRKRGVTLADSSLSPHSDIIPATDIIIGADHFYVFDGKMKVLGNDYKSVYFETSGGVILLGKVSNYLKNMGWFARQHFILDESQLSEPEPAENAYKCNPNFRKVVRSHLDKSFPVIEQSDSVSDRQLEVAVTDVLSTNYQTLTYDQSKVEEGQKEIDEVLVEYVKEYTTRNEEGRLTMPLLWNGKVAHLLGESKHLAEQVLKSNLRKLQSKEGHLTLADEVIKDQVRRGIIERIPDLDKFVQENPQHSFLSHMCVMKPDRETTKCRIVFLSNMCGKSNIARPTMNHNQTMLPGPLLNRKLSTALMQLRFDSKLLCFDLVKAFNQVELSEQDQSKLLFLWFENVGKGDFKIVAYKNTRLCFGLKCSPTILMLALHRILIDDAEGDEEHLKSLKTQLYDLFYVDNGALTGGTEDELEQKYGLLKSIFKPYCFELQQFVTNCGDLQAKLDSENEVETPSEVKLLGLSWDRIGDTLSTRRLKLDPGANTKRTMLSSLAKNFDVFSFDAPILNRARLFVHDLQSRKGLKWDSTLANSEVKEWKNIAIQVNSAEPMTVERFIGKRDGTYELLAFTDASKLMYGVVLYIRELGTGKVSFLMSKNKIVNKQLSSKTIPVLEFNSIVFGAQLLLDTFKELTGEKCVMPVKVESCHLYSDSTVAIHWLEGWVNNLDKMTKRTVFTANRFRQLSKICDSLPISYHFCPGEINPADVVSRVTSPKSLKSSNYYTGPDFLKSKTGVHPEDFFEVVMPSPVEVSKDLVDISRKPAESEPDNDLNCIDGGPSENVQLMKKAGELVQLEHVNRLSNLRKIINVQMLVLKFINNCKKQVNISHERNLSVVSENEVKLHDMALKTIILADQHQYYPEVFKFFDQKGLVRKQIPNIVTQLNVYKDQQGLLRIKSKMTSEQDTRCCPILLSNKSSLTRKIILDKHQSCAHAGIYTVLNLLKKEFWITRCWITVKKILKGCVTCARYHARTYKVPQSTYREFRSEPPAIPFRTIFIDHCGPFMVKTGSTKKKVWILVISCLWSRAVNLKVCSDMTVAGFLRALQLHVLEYGLPSLCLSDSGSQIVAGSKIILNYLGDPHTKKYLSEHGIKNLSFQQYYPGHHPLGGLVETAVKMTKQLIHSAVGKNVLSLEDFELLTAQTIHYANKRPIAFKEGLRSIDPDIVPEPITPENLIKGHDLVTVNLIPSQHPDLDPADPDWVPPGTNIADADKKVREARERLKQQYHEQFVDTLIGQAINQPGRYTPRVSPDVSVGDVVFLKEPMCKPCNYDLAVITELQRNAAGDVTGATLRKGRTRESLNRHISSLIPMLKSRNECHPESQNPPLEKPEIDALIPATPKPTRQRRKQFNLARKRIKALAEDD